MYSLASGYLHVLRSNVYFAGKMIWSDSAPVYRDRLGTNRASGARFRPYGDEITSTSNEREKFATYTRDGYTDLDYADQRYYASTYGRFNTADPYKGSAGPNDPVSWNRYSYVGGDPVNRFDPSGLDWTDDYFTWDIMMSPGGGGIDGPSISAMVMDQIAASIAAGIAAAAAAAQQQQQQPTCSISLEERPVGGTGADHTYLDLQGPASLFGVTSNLTTSETVEGGPTIQGCCGYLVGFVSNPPGGPNALPGTLPGGSGNQQVGQAYSGVDACYDISKITGAVSNYTNSGKWAIYNPVPELGPGYNSNSFTFTLLNDVNLSSYFNLPFWPPVPGWNETVPGLK